MPTSLSTVRDDCLLDPREEALLKEHFAGEELQDLLTPEPYSEDFQAAVDTAAAIRAKRSRRLVRRRGVARTHGARPTRIRRSRRAASSRSSGGGGPGDDDPEPESDEVAALARSFEFLPARARG